MNEPGNRKRKGTMAFERYAKYRDSMTVEEYVSICKNGDVPRGKLDALLDIEWDSQKRFIRLVPSTQQ